MTKYIWDGAVWKQVFDGGYFIQATDGLKQVDYAWVWVDDAWRLYYTRATPVDLTATVGAWDRIVLNWNSVAVGATYVLKRGGTQIYAGAELTFTDIGLTASTAYTYTVDAILGGTVRSTDTATATTPARPTVQKTVTLTCNSATSYSGDATDNRFIADNTNRADSRGFLFVGRYGEPSNAAISYYGHQKAYWTFDIPAEVRNCLSIDTLYISVYMEDVPYQNAAGSNFSMAVHHGNFTVEGYPPTPPPGHTGIFVTLHSMDLNWLGMTEWVEISNYVCPGRTTVKEEFRVNGAMGFMLKGLTDDPSDYGFATGSMSSWNRPRMQINYTVFAP